MTTVAPETGADTTTSSEPAIPCQSGWIWAFFGPMNWLNRFVPHPEENCPNAATWDEVRVCPDGTSHVRHSCDSCHEHIVTVQAGRCPCRIHGCRHESRLVACIRRGGAR